MLQVCVLEELAGLQASLLKETDDCFGSACITLGVSLDRGDPVLLLFSLTGENGTFSETREMNTTREIFQICHPIQGSVQVKIKAWNAFSYLEVDVFGSCDENSVMKLNSPDEQLLSLHKKMKKKHARVVRSAWQITATPSNSVNRKDATITLSISDSSITDDVQSYDWKCGKDCKCAGKSEQSTHTIPGNCLPDPLSFHSYELKLKWKQKLKKEIQETASICITLTPTLDESDQVSFSCIENCDPVTHSKDTKVKMVCSSCSDYAWFLEETDYKQWTEDTKDCYKAANLIPLHAKKQNTAEYVIDKSYIRDASKAKKNVTVVFTYSVNDKLLYKKYIIRIKPDDSDPSSDPTIETTRSPAATSAAKPAGTSAAKPTVTLASHSSTTSRATTRISEGLSCIISPSAGTVLDAFSITCTSVQPCSNCQYCFKTEEKHLLCSRNREVRVLFLPLGDSSSEYNLPIKATAKDGRFEVSTTLTAQVLDASPDSSSVDNLDSAVTNAVDKIRKEGLLSGDTIGEMFNSVAKKLNSQTDESKKENRQE
ncbi:hypothetical protein AMECASPLE_026442, partial [Ameca splendens]